MQETEKRPYRINYQNPDGTKCCYYIAAISRLGALADFRLRGGHGSATILSAEMRLGSEWKQL